SRVFSWWDPNRCRTFFIYGGYWKAKYASPPGLRANDLYGHSSNQEMVNGSLAIDIGPDDHVFLRPTQSESVFLQFGDLVILRGGRIVDRWPVLQA
ncbi:MAG: DSD1 family PLP-dependent enzyme, partial [Candidatus Binatia bacterium]